MPASTIHYLVNERPVPLIPADSVRCSSAAAGWSDDVVAECVLSPPMEWPEHTILGHRLLVNIGPPALHAWREDGRMREAVFVPGAMHVLPHGSANRARWGRCDVALIAIAPTLLERLLDGRAPGPSEVLRPCRNVPDPIVYDLARRIAAELMMPTERLYGDALGRALALHLLCNYGRVGTVTRRLKGRLSTAQAHHILEYMRDNLENALSVADLAAEASVSDAHFARAFHATFGEPPHRLMLRWRLERAQRLITNGGLRPSEAAVATGFYDQAHLTNAMRRHFGETPGGLTKRRP